MKKTLVYLSIIFLAACTSNPKGDAAETGAEEEASATKGKEYLIDTTSRIGWAASKPTATHTGHFKLKSGSIYAKDNNLTGGRFIIDITSLANDDMQNDPENKAKLEGHLKSPDFFNVSKFPEAIFEITAVEPLQQGSDSDRSPANATHNIKGNLTLLDSTKNISFPARITVDANTIAASADFNIDRTNWGINYKGPGNPEDWFISRQVNLKLSISATKK
jgi:polyisoprenoid-binding protein YceI